MSGLMTKEQLLGKTKVLMADEVSMGPMRANKTRVYDRNGFAYLQGLVAHLCGIVDLHKYL